MEKIERGSELTRRSLLAAGAALPAACLSPTGTEGETQGEPAAEEQPGRTPHTRFAVNVAKSNQSGLHGDAAIEDMVNTVEAVADLGIYTVVNLSCPNTGDGRTFLDPGPLAELLAALPRPEDRSRPLLVKLAPELGLAESDPTILEQVISVCEDHRIAGYVCGNTRSTEDPHHGRGGRSGRAARAAVP